MNKKFYALVAGVLLASSVSAFAQSPQAILTRLSFDTNVYSGALDVTTTVYDDATKSGGYEEGKSYLLSPDFSFISFKTCLV